MKHLILDIFNQVAQSGVLTHKELSKIIGKYNVGVHSADERIAKKKILPAYLRLKEQHPNLLDQLGVDANLEHDFLASVQMKPRRTTSGVATITVITKPWPCSSACLYCPNDLRMPKSYLSDEPACQRAAQNHFDPYLQVIARLRALHQMGHATDKIELIILGGTWSDYPESYQLYVMHELFAALNDGLNHNREDQVRSRYQSIGFSGENREFEERVNKLQHRVHTGELTYNQAVRHLYDKDERYQKLSSLQTATWEMLLRQQQRNESAQHRVVGLVIETRPDLITPHNLATIRRLGCTKVQIGIQSINQDVLSLNHRNMTVDRIWNAFFWLRRFGFKIHTHYMVNLLGRRAVDELDDYRSFMEDPHYMPDEVKLYPCVLVEDTPLVHKYHQGLWQPYSEDELTHLLAQMVAATKPFTRISRMIRDISSDDIMAGNKKTNLRQMVEDKMLQEGALVQEIRFREINNATLSLNDLRLEVVKYRCVGSCEYFLQWVTQSNQIAGFLRLSIPEETINSPQGSSVDNAPMRSYPEDVPARHAAHLPAELCQPYAMIREVHIYGQVARISQTSDGVQHTGLGSTLVNKAAQIAQSHNRSRLLVISSVGTKNYYRKLGFVDEGLYQCKTLDCSAPQFTSREITKAD